MKTIITLTIALIGFGFTFGQEGSRQIPVKKRVTELKAKPLSPSHTIEKVPARKFSYIGSYHVTGYHVLSVKTPGTVELEKIKGSIIKVDYTNFTGAEIDPMTYDLMGSIVMTRSEYIEYVFGHQVRIKEPDIPDQFLAHRTNHEVCKAFIELDKDHLAVPYQGVLLFLERR